MKQLIRFRWRSIRHYARRPGSSRAKLEKSAGPAGCPGGPDRPGRTPAAARLKHFDQAGQPGQVQKRVGGGGDGLVGVLRGGGSRLAEAPGAPGAPHASAYVRMRRKCMRMSKWARALEHARASARRYARARTRTQPSAPHLRPAVAALGTHAPTPQHTHVPLRQRPLSPRPKPRDRPRTAQCLPGAGRTVGAWACGQHASDTPVGA
jgi:hypothetical protein